MIPGIHLPYSEEFRRRMAGLARSGRTVAELAREFELTENTIRKWVQQADRDEGRRDDGSTTSRAEEIRRLKRRSLSTKAGQLHDAGRGGGRGLDPAVRARRIRSRRVKADEVSCTFSRTVSLYRNGHSAPGTRSASAPACPPRSGSAPSGGRSTRLRSAGSPIPRRAPPGPAPVPARRTRSRRRSGCSRSRDRPWARCTRGRSSPSGWRRRSCRPRGPAGPSPSRR